MLLVRVVSETDTGGVALAAEFVVAGGCSEKTTEFTHSFLADVTPPVTPGVATAFARCSWL